MGNKWRGGIVGELKNWKGKNYSEVKLGMRFGLTMWWWISVYYDEFKTRGREKNYYGFTNRFSLVFIWSSIKLGSDQCTIWHITTISAVVISVFIHILLLNSDHNRSTFRVCSLLHIRNMILSKLFSLIFDKFFHLTFHSSIGLQSSPLKTYPSTKITLIHEVSRFSFILCTYLIDS